MQPQNDAARVGELRSGAPAGDRQARADRRVDALDVGRLMEVAGGPNEVGAGGADRRAGADPADPQPIVASLKAKDTAAERGAEDECRR